MFKECCMTVFMPRSWKMHVSPDHTSQHIKSDHVAAISFNHLTDGITTMLSGCLML